MTNPLDKLNAELESYFKSEEFAQSMARHEKSAPETRAAIDHVKEKLEDLKVTVKDGFKGVYERQDKTNGNVKKNTVFRIETLAIIKFNKFLLGFFGFSNVATLIYLLTNAQ